MRGKGRTPEPGASLQLLDPSHLLLLSAKKLSKKKPSPASCFASCLRAIKSKNLKKLSEMDGAERRPELLHRGWVESGGGGTPQRGRHGLGGEQRQRAARRAPRSSAWAGGRGQRWRAGGGRGHWRRHAAEGGAGASEEAADRDGLRRRNLIFFFLFSFNVKSLLCPLLILHLDFLE